jgi:hypothetical protein
MKITRYTLCDKFRKKHFSRKRKAVQFIEFSLILPVMLYLMLLSIDMGRMVFLSGIVHDAAFYSAREGAIQGGAGGNVSKRAFEEAVSRFPGSPQVKDFKVIDGEICRRDKNIVRVRGEVEAELITPGLRSLLDTSSRLSGEGPWTLSAVGVGYCEISRQ